MLEGEFDLICSCVFALGPSMAMMASSLVPRSNSSLFRAWFLDHVCWVTVSVALERNVFT